MRSLRRKLEKSIRRDNKKKNYNRSTTQESIMAVNEFFKAIKPLSDEEAVECQKYYKMM